MAGRLYNCAAGDPPRPAARRRAQDPPAELPGVLRAAPLRLRRRAPRAASIRLAGQDGALRHRPAVRRRRTCPASSSMPRSARTSGCRSRPAREAALAGATVLANLSASNITIGKADTRRLLCQSQSARCLAAYVYAAAGAGESTTDLAWDGQASIYENGALLAESRALPDRRPDRARRHRPRPAAPGARPPWAPSTTTAAATPAPTGFRRVAFALDPPGGDLGLRAARSSASPSCPADPARLAQDCYEAYNIQVAGLAQRLRATRHRADRHRRLRRARFHPGADRRGQGHRPAGPAAHQHPRLHHAGLRHQRAAPRPTPSADGGARRHRARARHPPGRPADAGRPRPPLRARRAGLRHHLRERAGRACAPTTCSASPTTHGGIVLGTGDLSELALGWCTYGVGDQMSHYNVNAGVPKTLIQHLIRWVDRARGQFDAEVGATLRRRSSRTEISPELVPADAGETPQSTEAKIGPYALQDFNLFYTLRYGFRPSKIAFLALHAWGDAARGDWPPDFPEDAAPRLRPGRDPALAGGLPAAASSASASSSARPCRTARRSRPAARSRRAATGARPRTATPRLARGAAHATCRRSRPLSMLPSFPGRSARRRDGEEQDTPLRPADRDAASTSASTCRTSSPAGPTGHTPWMERVLPKVERLVAAHPDRTIFTRFIPPARPGEGTGTWRRYYERWAVDDAGAHCRPRHGRAGARPRPARAAGRGGRQAGLLPLAGRRPARRLQAARHRHPGRQRRRDRCLRARPPCWARSTAATGWCCRRMRSAAPRDDTHDALLTLYHERYGQQVEAVTTGLILREWR